MQGHLKHLQASMAVVLMAVASCQQAILLLTSRAEFWADSEALFMMLDSIGSSYCSNLLSHRADPP